MVIYAAARRLVPTGAYGRALHAQVMTLRREQGTRIEPIDVLRTAYRIRRKFANQRISQCISCAPNGEFANVFIEVRSREAIGGPRELIFLYRDGSARRQYGHCGRFALSLFLSPERFPDISTCAEFY